MSKGNGGKGDKNTGRKSGTPEVSNYSVSSNTVSNKVGDKMGGKTPKHKGNGNSST